MLSDAPMLVGPFEGNTSYPILYLANSADNITPLISAKNNSAGFPGSVILVQQNTYGVSQKTKMIPFPTYVSASTAR